MTPRIGSLCSGFGGLDLAVETVLPDAELAWYAQHDPDDKHQYAARIMAHHWPDTPNHGDITAIDYAHVEPVDILTAGFPCQDISLAGKRAGLREGTRSGIWSHVARAISVLRPSLVLLENVRSLTSAWADSDVEPCPWCLGDTGDEHSLRALGAVLGDLAGLGFDASWQVVRACDAGAPHPRARVFILAWPAADAAHLGHERGRGSRGRRDGSAHGSVAAVHAEGVGRRPEGQQHGLGTAQRGAHAADSPRDGRGEGRPEPAGIVRRPDAAQRSGVTAADAGCDARSQEHPDGAAAARCGRGTVADAQSERHGDAGPASVGGIPAAAFGGRAAAPANTDRGALGPQRDGEPDGPEADHGRHRLDSAGRFLGWGPYAAAIARWENVTGRPAPSPVDDRRRLNPPFAEWMMGVPAGWITAVPGIPRNAQLKAIGNGVVPQQGALALRSLLGDYRAAMTELAAAEGVAA